MNDRHAFTDKNAFYPFGQRIPVGDASCFRAVISCGGTDHKVDQLRADGVAVELQGSNIKTGRAVAGFKNALEIKIQIIAEKGVEIQLAAIESKFAFHIVSA